MVAQHEAFNVRRTPLSPGQPLAIFERASTHPTAVEGHDG